MPSERSVTRDVFGSRSAATPVIEAAPLAALDPTWRVVVWEDGYRTMVSYPAPADGMGVGLAICRGIVEACGGRPWATSNADGGTTVRFALPAAATGGA